jgi:Flp pilus assembly protein TadG
VFTGRLRPRMRWFALAQDRVCRFRSNDRGNILVISALMSVVLIYSVGVAVDYMDAVNFRTTLQSTVDSAALAGATAYTTCTATGSGSETTAQTIATNVFNATALPWHNGTITPTATGSTSGTACPGTPSSFNMTVTASGTVPTTFMSIIMPSMSVSATATAVNPVVNATANAGDWFSSAWDGNYIYWYPIPSDGSIPTFNAANMLDGNGDLNPTDGTFHFLFTNMPLEMSGGSAIASSQSISIAASQKIGFILHNVTGGRLPYGSGQYNGQTQGSSRTYYSQLANPDASVTTSDGSNNGGFTSGFYNPSSPHYPLLTCTNNGVSYPCGNAQNCSLEVVTTTVSDLNNNIVPTQAQNVCYGNTQVPLTGESCQQLGSQAVYYQWNDMGGGYDDMDYNDSEYGFYCGSGAGAPQVVHLIS